MALLGLEGVSRLVGRLRFGSNWSMSQDHQSQFADVRRESIGRFYHPMEHWANLIHWTRFSVAQFIRVDSYPWCPDDQISSFTCCRGHSFAFLWFITLWGKTAVPDKIEWYSSGNLNCSQSNAEFGHWPFPHRHYHCYHYLQRRFLGVNYEEFIVFCVESAECRLRDFVDPIFLTHP